MGIEKKRPLGNREFETSYAFKVFPMSYIQKLWETHSRNAIREKYKERGPDVWDERTDERFLLEETQHISRGQELTEIGRNKRIGYIIRTEDHKYASTFIEDMFREADIVISKFPQEEIYGPYNYRFHSGRIACRIAEKICLIKTEPTTFKLRARLEETVELTDPDLIFDPTNRPE